MVMIVLAIIWEVFVKTRYWSPAVVASPTEIMASMVILVEPEKHLKDVIYTLTRTILAFFISLPVGIFGGYLVFKFKSHQQKLSFFLDFLRSIPATALVPLFLIIFGFGSNASIAAGAFSGSLAIALATSVSLGRINLERETVINLLKLNVYTKFIHFELPEIAEGLFIGCRNAMSLCLILVVVSEMLGGSNFGMGKVIFDTQYSDDRGALFASILLTGIIGWNLNYSLVFVEAKIVHWSGK